MSMYKGHTRFQLFVAFLLLLIIVYLLMRPHLYFMITFASVFAYSTLFMSPDLDLAYQIRLFSVRGFFSIPFRSYAKFFSHRGLSHNFFLGSATRILWLLGWFTLIFLVLYKTLPTQSTFLNFYKIYQPYILYSLAAICLADWSHLLLDYQEKQIQKLSQSGV